jgi:hypothetical protein
VEKKKRVRPHRWYIEPLDANTNKAISMVVAEENAMINMPDNKGVQHDVYLIDSRRLSMFRASAADQNFRFNEYVREGNGEMHSAVFLRKAQRKKRRIPGQRPRAA